MVKILRDFCCAHFRAGAMGHGMASGLPLCASHHDAAPRHKYFLPPPRSAPPRSARSDCAGVRFAAPRASPAFRPASPHSTCSTRASSSREFLSTASLPLPVHHCARGARGRGCGARGCCGAVSRASFSVCPASPPPLVRVLLPPAHLKREAVQSQRSLHTLGSARTSCGQSAHVGEGAGRDGTRCFPAPHHDTGVRSPDALSEARALRACIALTLATPFSNLVLSSPWDPGRPPSAPRTASLSPLPVARQ